MEEYDERTLAEILEEINQKLKIKLKDGYLEVEVKEKKYDI